MMIVVIWIIIIKVVFYLTLTFWWAGAGRAVAGRQAGRQQGQVGAGKQARRQRWRVEGYLTDTRCIKSQEQQ